MKKSSFTENPAQSLGIRVRLDLPEAWRMYIRSSLQSDQVSALFAAPRQLQFKPGSGFYGHDFNPKLSAVFDDRRAA